MHTPSPYFRAVESIDPSRLAQFVTVLELFAIQNPTLRRVRKSRNKFLDPLKLIFKTGLTTLSPYFRTWVSIDPSGLAQKFTVRPQIFTKNPTPWEIPYEWEVELRYLDIEVEIEKMTPDLFCRKSSKTTKNTRFWQ